MQLAVPSVLASFVAVMAIVNATASGEKEARPDFKHFRSQRIEFTNQYLATATNILPKPSERVRSDVLPRVGLILTNKTDRMLWVLVRFMRPSGDPACDWAGPLVPKEETKFACTLDTVVAEVDYPVDIFVFSDEAQADTVEKSQTRLVFPEGDVRIIQGRLETRREEMEAIKLPRTYENMILREKLGAGANMQQTSLSIFHLGKGPPKDDGTLVVKPDGLEFVAKGKTVKISAAQLQGVSKQLFSYSWIALVSYEEGGKSKKLGLQPAAGAEAGTLDKVVASIEALIAGTAVAGSAQHVQPTSQFGDTLASTPTHAAEFADGVAAFCAKRFAEGFRILAPLAEKGDSDAQLIMGHRFFHGLDGKKDPRRARAWYTKAAEQGDAEAQVSLGLMLVQSGGGRADVAEALGWFRRAAEAGYSAGQYNLGYAYCTGQGVPQDTVLGPGWYQKAAEQGDMWAQANLGNIYVSAGHNGASRVIGYKWLLLASANGDEEAKKLVERYRPLMAEDELREAERQAGQFEPKPTSVTQLITRRCRPQAAGAPGKKDN